MHLAAGVKSESLTPIVQPVQELLWSFVALQIAVRAAAAAVVAPAVEQSALLDLAPTCTSNNMGKQQQLDDVLKQQCGALHNVVSSAPVEQVRTLVLDAGQHVPQPAMQDDSES